MKYCPYCLAPHERKAARFCCVEHQRRASSQSRSATMKLRRIMARIDVRVKHRARVRPHWRQLILGQDAAANVRAIFGTDPAPEVRYTSL